MMYKNTRNGHQPLPTNSAEVAPPTDTLIITGKTEEKYKSLLSQGWRKDALNKYIKEKLLQKRKKQREDLRASEDVVKQTVSPVVDFGNTQDSKECTAHRNGFIKLINIDSRFRTNILNTQSNNFVVDLNYTMRNVISMRLHEIEIPNSWYTFSNEAQNNRITISNQSVFPVEHHKFVFPDGNYDFSTLKGTLETLVSDLGETFGNLAVLNLNINTGRVQLVSPTSATFGLVFWNAQRAFDAKNDDEDPAMVTRTFGWLLGFRKNEYNTASVYDAEALIDISGTRYIYLAIDDSKTNLNDFVIGNMRSSYLNENIIARITLSNDKYQVINNNTTNTELKDTQTRFYPQPVKIDRLRIKLFDEYGKLLNLNGMDVSLTLEFTLENDKLPYLMSTF